MEVPEVETPRWQPQIPIISDPYIPNLTHIDQHGSRVQFVSSTLTGSSPVQKLTWEPQSDPM